MRTRLHSTTLLAAGILSTVTANGHTPGFVISGTVAKTQAGPVIASSHVTQRSPSSQRECCPVLELRQYTLKPGQRDAFIALFDRHFVESQEAVGMTLVGQYRDRRRPERLVWIRGFPDMQSRQHGPGAVLRGTGLGRAQGCGQQRHARGE